MSDPTTSPLDKEQIAAAQAELDAITNHDVELHLPAGDLFQLLALMHVAITYTTPPPPAASTAVVASLLNDWTAILADPGTSLHQLMHQHWQQERASRLKERNRPHSLLSALLINYEPTWHYSMEKTGHECSFCGKLIKERRDFSQAEAHAPDCAYIQALQWLREQDKPNT